MMKTKGNKMKTNFDRAFFSSLNFRVFTLHDYDGFAGVQSPVPLIAETDKFLVILDGDYAEVYSVENDWSEPVCQIDNVRFL